MIVALPGLFSYPFFTISVIVCLCMYVLVIFFILDSRLAILLGGKKLSLCLTKTFLFKYIENFTTKKGKIFR